MQHEIVHEFYRPDDDPFATTVDRLRGPRFITILDGEEHDDSPRNAAPIELSGKIGHLTPPSGPSVINISSEELRAHLAGLKAQGLL